MSNKLKIKFLGAQRPQEIALMNILTEVSPVSIRDLYMARTYATIIFNCEDDVYKLLTSESEEKLAAHHLKAMPSTENWQNRTIFITKLNYYLSNFSTEELINKINSSNNVNVQQLFVVKRQNHKAGQPISLKITLSTAEECNKIMSDGITIHKFDVPSDRIFLEDPINIIQCYRCFVYGHETNKCTAATVTCSKCTEAHNFRECKSTTEKCVLCNGEHIAISRTCPKRREYVAKLLNEKKQARAATNNNHPSHPPPPPPPSAPQPSPSNPFIYTSSSFPPLSNKRHTQSHPNTTPQNNTSHINTNYIPQTNTTTTQHTKTNSKPTHGKCTLKQ